MGALAQLQEVTTAEHTHNVIPFPGVYNESPKADAPEDTDPFDYFDGNYAGEVPGIDPYELFGHIVKSHLFELKLLGSEADAQGKLSYRNRSLDLGAHQVQSISPIRPGVARLRFNEPVQGTETKGKAEVAIEARSATVCISSLANFCDTVHINPKGRQQA